MVAFDDQQGWLPVENSRDCSLGFCTIYCPQWCYVLFPPSPPPSPPPPFSLTTNFNNHPNAFSPLVIATIGIFAAFFLLITYYTLVTCKFCGSFYFHRNHSHQRSNPNGNLEEEDSGGENYHQESWHLPPSTGLDEALIRKISICKYKRGEGLVEGTECSVCLSEFTEDENLRLLPKCSHAFHLQCIDTWLKSHSNCPLCRVNILLPSLAFEEDRAASAAENVQEAVVIIVGDLDLERNGDEVKEARNEGNMAKDQHRLLPAGSSSRRGKGERERARSGRRRGLLSVMIPVRMKRSVSSGRIWFARQGRGRAPLLLPGWANAA